MELQNGKYIVDFKEGNSQKGTVAADNTDVLIKRWSKDDTRGKNEYEFCRHVLPDQKELFTDYFSDGVFSYYVRKWLPGITLENYIEQSEFVSLSRTEKLKYALKTVTDICNILISYENIGRGIFIHGDITPENILLVGSSRMPALIDFESCLLLSDPDVLSDDLVLYRGGNTQEKNKYLYSAPEIKNGRIMLQSDIYSLAKIFCRIAELTDDSGNTDLSFLFDSGLTDLQKTLEKALSENPLDRQRSIVLFREQFSDIQINTKEADTPPVSVPAKNTVSLLPDTSRNIEYADKNFFSSISKSIVYIPDNLCFASELAFVCASALGVRTVLIDDSDLSQSGQSVNYFLSKKETSESIVCESDAPFFCDCEALYSANADAWARRGMLSRNKICDNLFISDCNLFSELGIIDTDDLVPLLNWMRTSFPLTIIAGSFFSEQSMENILIKCCDKVILPIRPDIEDVNSESKKYRRLCRQSGVPSSKLMYVLWEYENGISMSKDDFRIAAGGRECGTIPYDSNRRICKNHYGEFFCEEHADSLIPFYRNIVKKLGEM